MKRFGRIILFDFEFASRPGELPKPRCVVWQEWPSGRPQRLWLADGTPATPPYPVDRNTLFVAFLSSAERSCHSVLRWPQPFHVLDLYAEFQRRMSGLEIPSMLLKKKKKG